MIRRWPIEGVVLPWAWSRRDEFMAHARPTGRAVATARRLIAEALACLRFGRRQHGFAAPAGPRRAAGFCEDAPLLSRLLGREQVCFQPDTLRPAVAGRAILVTGAAGSIGSELCRQIAALHPRLLVAFDNAESGLFYLDQELRDRVPGSFLPWIGDVRDSRCLQEVIARHGFDAVFHAAAYKHVPLMEAYPLELIQTNVLGTWNLVREAAHRGVGRFVLISTDKAVHPANLMGLTKRAAELLAAGIADAKCRTRCASVRFGNVLGSSGSVVPIFHEQIACGGPVTVTHPDVRRYFMTIREAAHLVLQAAMMTEQSGTFVLDMGEPVRITDLARHMIRAWGLEPGRDIEIRYVGLRPGEKLDEELIGCEERALPTSHPKIRELRGSRNALPEIASWIAELRRAIYRRDESLAVAHLAALVPEYVPSRNRAARVSKRWREPLNPHRLKQPHPA
jgi:FlaA1/EpsC-like NDP-sugar epimerase